MVIAEGSPSTKPIPKPLLPIAKEADENNIMMETVIIHGDSVLLMKVVIGAVLFYDKCDDISIRE